MNSAFDPQEETCRFPSGGLRAWWGQACGGREMLQLAMPLVISTASWTVMNFIDRIFLLWYSLDCVAASLPAATLYWTILCLPLGLASYVNTFVAQYHGSGRPERIGLAVWQGIRVGIVATPLFLLTVPLAPWIFQLVGHDPSMVPLEALYYQVMAFAGGAAVTAAALSSFFTGRGETRVVMIVDSAAALLNALLAYPWIFGRWGFPAGGIEGAAWATVVAQWSRVLIYGAILSLPRYRRPYGLDVGRRFDRVLMRRLLRFGGPSGLQMLAETAAFTLFVLLVGGLGSGAAAATTLAFNVNSLAFVPMMGLSIAVTTMVGHQLGRDRPDLASRATWNAFALAVVYMGSMSLLYVLTPGLFLFAHASGMNPATFDHLRSVTIVLLRFVAVYSLFDAMNLVFVGAIKGAGDTRFVLLTHLVVAPLPLIFGWWGIAHGGLGLLWCWIMLTAWACLLGLVFLLRFLQGRWQSMRVIEPEDVEYGVEAVVSGEW